MVLMFTPIFAVWCGIWLLKFNSFKRIPPLIISGVLSLGLTAFFTIPVILEKGIVATDTLVVGYYEYTAHFASIAQILFSRFWGYGPSVWLTDDGMSFQVGWVHWILSLFILMLVATKFLKSKKPTPILLATSYMLLIGWFAAFMTHSRSIPIWLF
jgi:hypothetical protein